VVIESSRLEAGIESRLHTVS